MQYLVAHMLGDYLFQNRWMALNKQKNKFICLLHSCIYGLSVAVICGWWDWKAVVIVVSHFLIDYFKVGKLWRQFYSRDAELPWMITADNAIHLLILYVLSLI
jgi:hypothetical protein